MASSEDNSIKNETREEGDGEVRINSRRNILYGNCCIYYCYNSWQFLDYRVQLPSQLT